MKKQVAWIADRHPAFPHPSPPKNSMRMHVLSECLMIKRDGAFDVVVLMPRFLLCCSLARTTERISVHQMGRRFRLSVSVDSPGALVHLHTATCRCRSWDWGFTEGGESGGRAAWFDCLQATIGHAHKVIRRSYCMPLPSGYKAASSLKSECRPCFGVP